MILLLGCFQAHFFFFKTEFWHFRRQAAQYFIKSYRCDSNATIKGNISIPYSGAAIYLHQKFPKWKVLDSQGNQKRSTGRSITFGGSQNGNCCIPPRMVRRHSPVGLEAKQELLVPTTELSHSTYCNTRAAKNPSNNQLMIIGPFDFWNSVPVVINKDNFL